jgi:hypothetical protein
MVNSEMLKHLPLSLDFQRWIGNVPAYFNAANTQYDCAVGTADFVRAVMTLQKIQIPDEIGYPGDHDMYFYGRNMEKFHNVEFAINHKRKVCKHQPPFYIKPVKRKVFYSWLIQSYNDVQNFYKMNADYDLKTECWVSDVLDIQSEWRVYILDKQIVGIGFYDGNPTALPFQYEIKINNLIEKWVNQPVAFCIDIAKAKRVSSNCWDNYIIEINDFIHLGNYGLEDELYAKCCAARWKEIQRGEKIAFKS